MHQNQITSFASFSLKRLVSFTVNGIDNNEGSDHVTLGLGYIWLGASSDRF